ncbi:MAG TPA: twin-arginine translocase TatA/TatE family subunit [Solirubrobacteraceae bacterium]|nr:twin-arginine translocase TatA/TatE family subunit [Solirubrobacteraceae bacterium]
MLISDILQPTHLLLLLAVVLLVLGPKRLPEAARAVGRGLHDFKGAVSGEPLKAPATTLDRDAGTAAQTGEIEGVEPGRRR